MKTIKILAVLFAIAIIGQSCRNDSDEYIVTPPVPEPEIKVTSSVLGTVIDAEGYAVEGAMVTFEDKVIFTDNLGVFQFRNEQLYSSGTYIKVSKEGFFEGSRRFYPTSKKTSLVAIELIPLEIVGNFNSAEGSLQKYQKFDLNFEANSIVNEDGSAYSGNVNIAAKYLDPTYQNTLDQMPGDLTGTTIDQNRVVLTSIAMVAVELMDDNGNELQIKEGKTVEAKIPVPTSLQNDAPTSIPMWYFDESAGTWVEEGSASYEDGDYVTHLSHFSFWNCDIPNDMVFLKGSIANRGIPIQGISVVLKVNNRATSASTITDAEGFFCGFVPKDQDLTLEVYNRCGNIFYTTTIPSSDSDIMLEPINLFEETHIATISGSVALCNGTPSSQTYVSASQGILNNVIAINEDFTFAANVSYCDESELLVSAVDPINVLVSEVSSYSIEENIEVGTIELCEDSGQLVDNRDGQKYPIVEINGQIWTAENMRFDTDDGIANGYDDLYSHVPAHYGRLYNYYSAQEACPDGWHLPSQEEYKNLIGSFSPVSLAGIALKSIEDWNDGGNGTNSSGFNAFPVGIFTQNGGSLDYTGRDAAFWSSTKSTQTGQALVLSSDNSGGEVSGSSLFLGFSVRCVKD